MVTKILITGGSGFIGKNLISKFNNLGKDFWGGVPFTEFEVVDFSRSNGHDLFDLESSRKFIHEYQPSAIFNLASHGGSLHYVSANAAAVISDNMRMSLNLYEIAKDMPNVFVINPISNCSYPGDTSIQREAEWLNGPPHESVFSFANSKRALYNISRCYTKQYGVKTINFIFPNAFGIYDNIDPNKTHAIDGMIIRMLKAKRAGDAEFEVWGTGSPIREWIYSEDFAFYLLQGLKLAPTDEPLNIAQGRGYSIKESVELIKEVMGYEGKIVFNTKYKDGDPIKVLDNTKFLSIFGDYPFTDHREAIEKTIKYYEGVL